ncbi:TIGR03084 family metal-binding protein, partial [Actinophytocola sp.]|uniref:TIGR03084 family metal-binding protein n=1 Tax=Actinophytocola sp. TaxID=1872138 RepID=UPI003D6AE515
AERAERAERAVDRAAAKGARMPPAELLAGWRLGREELAGALERVPDGTKLLWYGPPMSAASMVTARMMETWAHGYDIADALDVRREPTGRLRHVAHIAVRARDFAFGTRGLTPPAEPFRVELAGPGGEAWTWGPAEAAQRVTGPALDFCLLATQRVHRADTALAATGADADRWLDIAQAFAGPPGVGRDVGSRA